MGAIRLASNLDTEGIVSVIREVYEEYGFTWDGEAYMADIHDVQKHFFALGGRFWVWDEAVGQASEGQPAREAGTEDESVLGTVGIEVFDQVPGEFGRSSEHEGRVRACGADCSLERLYVRPTARRRGIGAALTAACIAEAKALGRTGMEIWSDKHFGDAHRLYERFGARVIGDRICHDPDQSPEWGMVIRL